MAENDKFEDALYARRWIARLGCFGMALLAIVVLMYGTELAEFVFRLFVRFP